MNCQPFTNSMEQEKIALIINFRKRLQIFQIMTPSLTTQNQIHQLPQFQQQFQTSNILINFPITLLLKRQMENRNKKT